MDPRLDDLLDLSLGTAFAPGDTRASANDAPLPNQIGRYAVRALLGRGGLGAVYLAHDPQLGRDVAIKVLRRAPADAALLEHFREEARTCSQLQHPGIVPVHELGTTDDGRLYYTMRVVGGPTLQQLLARGDADRRHLLAILERAAQAVAFAHSHGVVHGDLTPANIMAGDFGEVQVLDWGLSRQGGDHGAADPHPRRAIGTPAYMAREQSGGDRSAIDSRTDVFGLGAILCEILTGSPPYRGDSIFQVHQRAATGAIDDAVQLLQAVVGDRNLVDLARRCLAPEPSHRPTDAAIVAGELAAHQRRAAADRHRLELEAAAATARAHAARRANRLTILLASFVVIGVVGAGAAWIHVRGQQSQRRVHANERAIAALATARQLSTAAGDEAGFAAALTAVATAAEAAAAADADPHFAPAAAALHREIDAALDQARVDATLRQQLAERRWHAGDDRSPREIEADYVDSFARCGIDVDADPVQVAGAVRAHRLHHELSGALHGWALQRHRARLPTAEAWRPLLTLADRCDLDPQRNELRSAFLAGDLARLRATADAMATVELPPESIDLLGQFLVASGDRAAAIALLRRTHPCHPGDYDLCHGLATLLVGQQPAPRAEIRALMTTAAALRPDSAHARTDLALTVIEEGRLADARPIIAHALDLDPGYSRAWYCASILRDRDGDLPGALDALAEYARLQPASAKPKLLLARLLERNGRRDEALSACREAVAMQPRWGDALQTLGLMLFERGHLLEACDVVERSLPFVPRPDLAQLLLGRTQHMLGQNATAVATLRDALGKLPDQPHVRFHLGLALASCGQLREAVEQIETAEVHGRQEPGWPYPPTVLTHARTLLALEPRLDRYLEDGIAPAPEECVQLGDLAMSKGHALAAHRLFASASAARADLADVVAERHARAAARVAFATEAGEIDTATRLACARLALDLLQASLDRPRRDQADDAVELVRRRLLMNAWRVTPELTATRGEPPIDWLPPDLQADWHRLWSAVDRELAKP